jgi:hypothetical protein
MTNEQAMELVLHAARDKAREMECTRHRGWKEHSARLWEAIELVGKQNDPRWEI